MWEQVRLREICEIQPPKKQVKTKLSEDSEISFMPMDKLGIGEMYPKAHDTKTLKQVYSSYTYFENNDVLLAKITPCFENGKLGIANNLINGVGFGSSEFVVLRCSEKLFPQFLYYHLSCPKFRYEGERNMSGAVGHKRVQKDFIENNEISLPPLAEQQRIVAKLDAAFAEIDEAILTTKNKVNDAASLFEAFLTNTIENANLPCKKMSLDDLAKFLDYRGKTPKKTDSGVVLLTAKNVRMGYIKAEPKEFISEEEYKVRMTRGFPKLGDVVFTTEAPLGLVSQIEDETVALGQRLITFQIKNGVIQNKYLKYALMSRHYQQEIYTNGTGATAKGIKARLLKKIQITFPASNEEQTKRVESLQMAEEKKNELVTLYSSKLVELHKLKSAILAQELQSSEAA